MHRDGRNGEKVIKYRTVEKRQRSTGSEMKDGGATKGPTKGRNTGR